MKPAAQDTAYSTTPLPKKLGLVTAKGPVAELAILNEPDSFRGALGDLAGITVHSRLRPSTNLALCFVRSRVELVAMLELLTAQLPPDAHVWLIKPKTCHKPDFNENHMRDLALAAGLVDYKVCSVDADWSGLKFCWRRP